MQGVPTHAALLATIGELFTFTVPDGSQVQLRLTAAPGETPMDDAYVCFSAIFELPAGVQLPQHTYRITAPDGAEWDLLATPTRPSGGRWSMAAVMHYLRSAETAVDPVATPLGAT